MGCTRRWAAHCVLLLQSTPSLGSCLAPNMFTSRSTSCDSVPKVLVTHRRRPHAVRVAVCVTQKVPPHADRGSVCSFRREFVRKPCLLCGECVAIRVMSAAVVIRSTLAPFDCTTRSGVRTMDADASIECDVPGGSHSRMWRVAVRESALVAGKRLALVCRLSEGASVPLCGTFSELFLFPRCAVCCFGATQALTMVLYVVGLPVAFAVILVKHRAGIRFDQSLKLKGEGDTSLTNPYLHLRKRYGKLYGDYHPQFTYWKLFLFARKLLFAAIIVMMNGNVEAQVRGACTFGKRAGTLVSVCRRSGQCMSDREWAGSSMVGALLAYPRAATSLKPLACKD
jgi:hypothetical protein